ncbi:MAG: hypothetical protein NTW21_29430 [Verrucomicrobia bacterium]|nr:hypothetical protein [Verrucomicrobiota bacterium]
MSLDLSRLQNVRQCGVKTIARCPACTEDDRDETGEHLVIYQNGKFGCVTCPGAAGHEHRKRILALAGDPATRRRGACVIRVRRPTILTKPKSPERDVELGRIGRVDPALLVSRAVDDVGCVGESLPVIAGGPDNTGRFGRLSTTLALRESQDITCDGVEGEMEIHTRSIGVKSSEASGLSETDPLLIAALAQFSKSRQATPAAQDTDPETGFPIINGAVCPF